MTTTLQPTDRSFVDRDEAIARAKRFYKEELLPRYEDTHKGHFIIVDGLSLDYEIGDLGWDSAACTRFRNRRLDSITWSIPIGGNGFSIGGYPWEVYEDAWFEVERRFAS